jgi:cyclophilin family peptidyl-prolyl cis-trans isomerase/HEAT repeat protein
MARALAMLGGIAACAALVIALGAGAPSTGYGTLAAVLRAEQARTVTPALLRAAASRNEGLAVRAILALGRTKRRAAVPALRPYLSDPRPAVRAMSLYALGLIAGGGDRGAIARGLGDPNGAVRVAALDAADRYLAAGLLPARAATAFAARIERVLASDGNAVVRARAAATLESFATSAAGGPALGALTAAVRDDGAPQVREFAMWSIYRGYASRVNPAFVRAALRDRDEIVRIEAVHAVGAGRIASDAPGVRALLRDPSWRVQEQAAQTLRLLHGLGLTQHWLAIPSYVHLPPARPDPLASLRAYPRHPRSGAPHAPTVREVLGDRALWGARLDPQTAAAMSGPAPGPHPRVRIVTTQGNVYVTLFPEWAPFTVENFLALVDRGYYDRNHWFRIVPDFVVQTGDPHDNGNGDAGYAIRAEENPIAQDSGVISMGLNYTNPPNAHAIRDSAGAQYYVTLSPQLHLDRDFTVFGRVTSGAWVLGRLTEADWVVRIERVPDQDL